jgi:PAS domain S-box-containing protein
MSALLCPFDNLGSFRLKNEIRILMLEDKAADAELACHALREVGMKFKLTRVETREGFTRELQENTPDLILSDHALPAFDGFTALTIARETHPEIPFIFFTGPVDDASLIDTLKRVATDHVLKLHPADLASAVRRAFREQEERSRRTQAEEAFRRSEEMLRLLIENVTDYAIYMLDPEGRVGSWNAGAERMTGFRADEVVGNPMQNCFAEEEINAGKLQEELKRAATEGRIQAEGWCVRKDGSRYFANWIITAVRDASGKPASFLKVARDVTERKKHEEQIARWNSDLEKRVAERTAQLEAANKELESFSYSVSHDLRAPLRHIDGFVEILQGNLSSILDEENREHLKTIADAARQMGRLIDDLLGFSRMSRARMNKKTVSLADLVKDAIRQLKHDADGRDIEWITESLPDVVADPSLLRQVLVNLISNALKYTRTRSRARIELGTSVTEDEIIFFIRDNGVGFDMRYADRLFGVFQRLHRASEFEGTGVGLANVRRIIHRHGGRTWAEGVVNSGATFYFSLPKQKEVSSDLDNYSK